MARLAKSGGVDERTQERDYVLTWLIAAMSELTEGWIFKGGTCLRRCYLPDYRYSEDLDFTISAERPTSAGEELGGWCDWIEHRAGIRAAAIADESDADRAWITFTGPVGAVRDRAIKVDATANEHLIFPVAHRVLVTQYSDLEPDRYWVPCYSLEEIWSEKTRSLMQRTEARDLYDLNALAGEYPDIPVRAKEAFESKAKDKGFDPANLDNRLDEGEAKFRQGWEQRLHDQIRDLPDFEDSWRTVRRVLRQAGYTD